jgi:hypothetical protein
MSARELDRKEVDVSSIANGLAVSSLDENEPASLALLGVISQFLLHTRWQVRWDSTSPAAATKPRRLLRRAPQLRRNSPRDRDTEFVVVPGWTRNRDAYSIGLADIVAPKSRPDA